MKHRVERSLEGTGWVVLDPTGDVVYVTVIWEWAIDEALVRYNMWLYDSIIRIAYE